jgi:FkbM family methyltransferase
MANLWLKRIAARLPERWQAELKRLHFRRQIRRGAFATAEPEYARLPEFLREGDWAIDIGANIGHYTKAFSDLVGATGRVIAIEPVPETFALLAANVQLFRHRNVSLFNVAASDRLALVGMTIPRLPSGLLNNYEATLTPSLDSMLTVLTIPVDAFGNGPRIALIKIDAEGHEARVLDGLERLVVAHRPTLIIETGGSEIATRLGNMGYETRRLPGSPNILGTAG